MSKNWNCWFLVYQTLTLKIYVLIPNIINTKRLQFRYFFCSYHIWHKRLTFFWNIFTDSMVLASTEKFRPSWTSKVPPIRNWNIESAIARLWGIRRNEWHSEIPNSSRWSFNWSIAISTYMVSLTVSHDKFWYNSNARKFFSFNQLDLPVYKSYDKLRTNLLKAIHECSEGFGFA